MEPIGRTLYNNWRQSIARNKPEGEAGPVTAEWEDLPEWERESWQEAAEQTLEG